VLQVFKKLGVVNCDNGLFCKCMEEVKPVRAGGEWLAEVGFEDAFCSAFAEKRYGVIGCELFGF
jgi:hypothetical protein